MQARTVNIDNLAYELEQMLDEYADDINENVRTVVKDTATDMVAKTKKSKSAHKGRRNGKFFNYITHKPTVNTRTEYEERWYVRSPEYRLTHLLNNGHMNRDGSFYPGDPFVTRAADELRPTFVEKMREAVENAGR